MLLKRSSSKDMAEAAGGVWVHGVSCETFQSLHSCAVLPVGAGGKESDRGVLLVYSTFIFMGVLIGF